MAVWSCLRNIGKLNTFGSALATIKNAPKTKAVYYFQIRMSHGETMQIKTSSYKLLKAKDLIMFYLVLGLIPIVAVATYTNIFIGPAELAVIPEGYEPKHWEYYRHPITRFIAKNWMLSPQERYERNLHNIFIDEEISQIKKLKFKIREKIKERLDYQSWYYVKPPVKYRRKIKEDIEEQKREETTARSRMLD